MINFNTIYDLLKNLKDVASEYKNQQMLNLAVEIQAKLFDLNEENQDLKNKNLELNQEIFDLKKQIEDLRLIVADKSVNGSLITEDYKDFEFPKNKIKLKLLENRYVYTFGTKLREVEIDASLENVFENISPYLTSNVDFYKFRESFSSFKEGYILDKNDAMKIKSKLLALKLIIINEGKDNVEFIKLSKQGLLLFEELNK